MERLKSLMKQYKVNNKQLAAAAGILPEILEQKLNKEIDFTFIEAVRISNFFRELGADHAEPSKIFFGGNYENDL